MTSQQGRLYKTYYQLVKSRSNFQEHFAAYVRSVYIQISMDFSLKHVC